MALATTAPRFIDFQDARLPPRIDTGEDCDNDYSSLQMHSLQSQDLKDSALDNDGQSLFVPLPHPKLTRSGSLGNSWGVTAVGRGFGGKAKRAKEEDNDDDVLSKDAVPDLDNSEANVTRSPFSQSRPSPLISAKSPTIEQISMSPLVLPNEPPLTPPSDSPSPAFPEVQLITSPRAREFDRPVLATRAQSMYILGPTKPALSVPSDETVDDQYEEKEREQIRLGRQRAWSRPLNSPMRSPSVPLLAPSTSAPHLASRHTLTPLTPVDPLLGLSNPATPRSPRLTRARNSQKRISLVAGRQVAGLSLLGMDADADGASEDIIMFGSSRIGTNGTRGSPPPMPRSQSPTSTSSDSPVSSPVEPSDPFIGRAMQIKSLGRLSSESNFHPPTPLRVAPSDSRVASGVNVREMVGTPISISDAAVAAMELPVPVEDAPAPPEIEYPSLDVPGPNFSLSRLSSSWSISGPHHHHRPSMSSLGRNSSIGKKSMSPPASATDGYSPLDGRTLKRISSDASALSIGKRRGGGYLGGKTIDDYVVWGELGRGAYGMVNRAKERKKPEVVVLEDGSEVIMEAGENETVGQPLIIKQIIKSRILADCWKKHPVHGTIPIEIYVMSALSGTSYVLPTRRAWDPRRFDHWAEEDARVLKQRSTSSSATVTPHSSTIQVHQTFAEAAKESNTTHGEGCTGCEGGDLEDIHNPHLENWRWVQGELIKGHPNICPLEDFFEDAQYYYLVLPATKPSLPKVPAERMIGGGGVVIEPGVADGEGDVPAPKDLFDLVELYPVGLPAALIRSYLGQIADALSFLHARGICHRDIKDENVVLGEHGRCWLIDFGSSGVIRRNGWDSFSGTLDYAAPEILQGARYAGPPQDVWAFGIVAYVLLTGECPFSSAAEAATGLEDPENKAALALRERCSGGPGGFDEGLEKDGGGRLGDAMEMLRRCLEVDVAKRPTMEEVLTCRYLVGGSGWGQELTPVQSNA